MKTKKIKVKAFAVTDWGGGLKYPSVSIFDCRKDAQKELDSLNRLPDGEEGEPNKIIRVEIKEI